MTNHIKPYAHQVRGFDFVKDRPFFALFMEQGTGKTKLAFMVGSYRFERGDIDMLVVIAPNGIHSQWIDEQAPLHCDVDYISAVWENKKTKKYTKEMEKFYNTRNEKLKLLAVNVEAFSSGAAALYLSKYLNNHRCMVVVDESTRIKSPTAARTKTIHNLTRNAVVRCILTGTPSPNSPFDLWSQFNFLSTNYFGINYFSFRHYYGILCRDNNPISGKMYHKTLDEKTYSKVKIAIKKNGGKLTVDLVNRLSNYFNTSIENIQYINKMDNFTPYKNLGILHKKIAPVTYKVKKADCLDLPPKVYERITVDLSPEQKRVIKELKKNQISSYNNKDMEVLYKLTLTLRLQQVAGGCFPYMEVIDNPEGVDVIYKGLERFDKNPKLNALINDLDEVENKTQIIIWANFVEELKIIYEKLTDIGEHCGLYYGETSTEERKQIIQDFQRGKLRVLIANRTAAEGLNLQCATLHYFYSNGWYGDKREQAEDRSHRSGQKRTVVYKDLIANGTMDDTIYRVLKDKINLCDYFRRE